MARWMRYADLLKLSSVLHPWSQTVELDSSQPQGSIWIPKWKKTKHKKGMDMEVTINLHYKSSASSLWPRWSQVSINTVWIKWWRADRLHFPNCAKTNAKYAEDGKRLTGNRECYFISQSNRLAPFLFLFFLLEWHWHLCVLSLLVHLAEFTGQCWASQVAQWLKNWSADAGDAGSIPGSGWFPGEGNGNSLQYSCLESPVARGAWRAAVHSIAKSCMWWATEHAHAHRSMYPGWHKYRKWGMGRSRGAFNMCQPV